MSFEDVKRSSFDVEKHSQEHYSIADVGSLSLSSVGLYVSHTRIGLQVLIDDPNFDPAAVGLEDESPYPEVRSAVANTDDPTIPASTLRAWVFGLLWAIVIPGANQFFFFRYPAVNISQVGLALFFLSFLYLPLLNQVPRAKSSSSPSF